MPAVGKFTKIPHAVEAIHWDGDQSSCDALSAWCKECDQDLRDWPGHEYNLELGGHLLQLGWWVVRRGNVLTMYSPERFHDTFWNEKRRIDELNAAMRPAKVEAA